MSRRRWIGGGVVAIAALLLIGRLAAGWYVEYIWYDALGAAAIWRARTIDLLLMRGLAFVVGTTFVFLNLYAVRHSVVSLVLPRRVGDLEIGEEVPGRYLMGAVIIISLVLGLALALPHSDWTSFDLLRHGEAFRESDPYFRFDMAFWIYWLPLEVEAHLWSLITLLVVTLLVVVLYALTPSLRWEGGRLRVSSYVRRHFFALGAILLVLLGWSYRLDAYELLLNGSGALGVFNALDHRVGIPASLVLALGTIAAAMLLLWSGWVGQFRIAFATVSMTLLLALALRQFLPPIAERFLEPSDADVRDASYFKTRAGYTRRAYNIERITTADSAGSTRSLAGAVRGAASWDPLALERALAHERRAGHPMGAPGWESQDGRLHGLLVEQPSGTDASEALARWNVVRVDAGMTTEQGAPLSVAGSDRESALPGAIVHDSASGYAIVIDSLGQIAAPTLRSLGARVAYAWGLQNPRLLTDDGPRQNARLVMHRDVRGRVRRIFPFLLHGARVAPVVYRDSLFWSVHLYAASATYPLSDPMRIGNEEVRYFQHAGVAMVNAHTGRVFAVADPSPDPITLSWMKRFPFLFVSLSALPRELTAPIPPPVEAALVHARLFAHVGPRGVSGPPSHLPRQHGGDTLFSFPTFSPFVDSTSGNLALAYPILDASDRMRGVVVATGGADYAVRWQPFATPGPRWMSVVDRLHRAVDSLSQAMTPREAPLVRGPVRLLPYGGASAYVQTAYLWRGEGTPAIRVVAVLADDTVRTGSTIAGAVGLPVPTMPTDPLTPSEFFDRVEALYGDMREAMRRGDWLAFGAAYESLGRTLRSVPAPKP
ncbi:MAG: UPF0182 family protein [Gemmatimonadaceae bacterium]